MSRELLLFNGAFHTMEPGSPRAFACAIRAGRFLFVGDESGARAALAGGARAEEIDLGGRCVLPGLTDSHLHFLWYTQSLHGVYAETPTLAEALARVRSRAAESAPGEWITGSGWNHNVWGTGALPDKRSLDEAAPRNPVMLEAKSGHALWVNSLALKTAGIELDTPDPAGGKIAHGGDGMPSGILLENAMRLVQEVVPRPSARDLAHMMKRAQLEAHQRGLTGVHDFDRVLAFEAFQEMHAAGDLSLRVVKGIPHEMLSHAVSLGLRSGFGDDLLQLGPVKMFSDGALGPQTASMLAPYEGTWATGIPTMSEEELFQDILRANSAGLACAVHAIGDAACHVVLNAFQRVAERLGQSRREKRLLRNRMEHVQLLHPNDLRRLAKLSIIASMQPIHATSDMMIAERHWGARCETAYAWKSLLDTGARLAFGSDCPVEIPDPLAGIHAAVTRRRADGSPGPEGWRGVQRLTVEQAVHGYTLGAAYACGREAELGSITPGKLADLTILDQDIFSMPPHDIRKAVVSATIVGGKLVYRTF
ncbi:MAG: amidohydrolase [Spirochaetia bacterium]